MTPLDNAAEIGGQTTFQKDVLDQEVAKKTALVDLIKAVMSYNQKALERTNLVGLSGPDLTTSDSGNHFLEIVVKEQGQEDRVHTLPIKYESTRGGIAIAPDGTVYPISTEPGGKSNLSLVSLPDKEGKIYPLVSGTSDVPQVSRELQDKIQVGAKNVEVGVTNTMKQLTVSGVTTPTTTSDIQILTTKLNNQMQAD